MTHGIPDALQLVPYDKEESHWPDMVRNVALSLALGQLKLMNDNKRLRGSDLTPDQRDSLQQAIYNNEFAMNLKVWQEALPALENISHSMLHARSRNVRIGDENNVPFDYLCTCLTK